MVAVLTHIFAPLLGGKVIASEVLVVELRHGQMSPVKTALLFNNRLINLISFACKTMNRVAHVLKCLLLNGGVDRDRVGCMIEGNENSQNSLFLSNETCHTTMLFCQKITHRRKKKKKIPSN